MAQQVGIFFVVRMGRRTGTEAARRSRAVANSREALGATTNIDVTMITGGGHVAVQLTVAVAVVWSHVGGGGGRRRGATVAVGSRTGTGAGGRGGVGEADVGDLDVSQGTFGALSVGIRSRQVVAVALQALCSHLRVAVQTVSSRQAATSTASTLGTTACVKSRCSSVSVRGIKITLVDRDSEKQTRAEWRYLSGADRGLSKYSISRLRKLRSCSTSLRFDFEILCMSAA